MIFVRIVMIVIVSLIIMFLAFFIGKTTITETQIVIERPTLFTFYLFCIITILIFRLNEVDIF